MARLALFLATRNIGGGSRKTCCVCMPLGMSHGRVKQEMGEESGEALSIMRQPSAREVFRQRDSPDGVGSEKLARTSLVA